MEVECTDWPGGSSKYALEEGQKRSSELDCALEKAKVLRPRSGPSGLDVARRLEEEGDDESCYMPWNEVRLATPCVLSAI